MRWHRELYRRWWSSRSTAAHKATATIAPDTIELIRKMAKAICERFLGSVRRECLDHVLVLGDRHLERVLAEYVRYFNAERPHQGLAQQIPTGAGQLANTNGRVVTTPVLGGLHHAYRRAA